MKLSTKVLIGLGAGIIAGLILNNYAGAVNTWIKPFGTLFLNLIKMIIVPLVFASLVMGASSLGDLKKLGRIGGKTIVYYLATTVVAVTIGLIIAHLFNPGVGLTLPVEAKYAGKEAPALSSVLLGIVPTNPFEAMVSGNMLQIIVFGLFVGIGITAIGTKGAVVKAFFDGFAELMFKITGWIMEFAPYGVFALITPVVAANGPGVLFPLAKVILAVYIACILHAAIIYSAAVSAFGRKSPLAFFKGILPAQLIAFSTCSSAATLPVTMKCTEENLGVSKGVSSFVLPLGATVNMDGTAIYQGVAAIFVAQIYGLDLSLGQQLIIILTATLGSIGAAGVPGAGLIMLTMVLTSVNLPLEGMAIIAGIDRILDMARTTINVTGDACGSVVVASTEGELRSVPAGGGGLSA
ncbi:MAG: dicarboxylate/amino acid:cation symporter [Bacillota bacterium]